MSKDEEKITWDNYDVFDFDEESSDSPNEFESPEGKNYLNPDENSIENNIVNKKSMIKTALIYISLGIIMIALALGLSNLLKNKTNEMMGNSKIDKTTEELNINTETNNSYNEINVMDKNQFSKSTLNTEVNESDNWIEFKAELGVEFDRNIKALFTVTSINHFTRVVENSKDMIVRSIIKGNISGLTGTYEIVVPYEKARLLTDGAVFTIQYNYGVYEGKKIIGEIIY